jgi:hypothetical protein
MFLNPDGYRNIFRGGTTIQPILSNQIGYNPATFTSSIQLVDKSGLSPAPYDFQATLNRFIFTGIPSGSWETISFTKIITSGSNSKITYSGGSYKYEISSSMVSSGVDLTFVGKITTQLNPGTYTLAGLGNVTAYARLVKYDGATTTVISPQYERSNGVINFSYTVDNTDLVSGDQYLVQIYGNYNFPSTDSYAIAPTFYYIDSTLQVNQYPIGTNGLTIPTASLWTPADTAVSAILKSTLGSQTSNFLLTTQSALVSYYDNPYVYQQNIPNSGLNSFDTPWSLKTGDEIRFENREDRVWMINNVNIINEVTFMGITTPLSSSLLVIETDSPISQSNLDYDQFLIRRYVDGNYILVDGPKSTTNNGQGPFIVKPQYINPQLDKGLDYYIQLLTEKGLL